MLQRLCLLTVLCGAWGFRSVEFMSRRSKLTLMSQSRKDGELPEITPGEIDWDAEWQRTLRAREENKDVTRPNEMELEMERAKKRAMRSRQSVMDKTSSATSSVQKSISSATSSWNKQSANFYLGCLAAISFLPAIFIALSSSVGDEMSATSYLV